MIVTNIECNTGEKTVIASGIGITFGAKADYKISLKIDNKFSLSICFNFEDDLTNKQASLQKLMHLSKDNSNCKMTLKCINFNDIIGAGTIEPVLLTKHNNSNIYINFWIRTPEEKTSREIRYCIYQDNTGEKTNGR